VAEVNTTKGISKGVIKLSVLLGISFAVILLFKPFATEEAYRAFPVIGSRVWVWIIAQLHLNFAAFVLGVPIFAVAMEYIGWRKGDERLDKIAHDFAKLFTVAYTITAILGTVLLISLPILYPKFIEHMMKILGPTWWLYVVVMYVETVIVAYYYYSWNRMKENSKGKHVFLGLLVNIAGTALLLITSSWVGYMTTPGGVNEATGELVSRWEAIKTYMWIPLSMHRLVANVVFGASIAAAYAAYRFITCTDPEEKAYYDWMGFTAAMISIAFYFVLPGVGYLLGVEIYAFNEQMGIQLMGGFFAWLWVMQAILMGLILFFINYYLWISLNKMPGGERYFKYVKLLYIFTLLGWAIWMTPHSVAVSLEEARRIGSYHPILGNLGVMASKNTATIVAMLATFYSYAIFRIANKEPTVPWAKTGIMIKAVVMIISFTGILFIGWYSYIVPAEFRVKVLSTIQFGLFFGVMIATMVIDKYLYKDAHIIGEPEWGKMPDRSQYSLIGVTVTFTWLMSLLGYMRSGGRQYWHVYGIMQDTSPDAFLPTHGFAAVVASITTILFFFVVAAVFWGMIKTEKVGEKGRTS
jgi:cytochrome bd-type quinol oxidase subunit 1